jgi:hypothetical protein
MSSNYPTKKLFNLIAITIAFLMMAACQSEIPSVQTLTATATYSPLSQLVSTATRTPTDLPTFTPTPTYEPWQGPTMRPSATSTPTQRLTRTAYPTLQIDQIITVTPGSPAECPVENPDLQLSFDSFFENFTYTESIQQAFDEGATLQQVAQALNQAFFNDYNRQGDYPLMDLTGDGIEELVVHENMSIVIYGCHNGENTILLNYDLLERMPWFLRMLFVEDMNLNGQLDIVIRYGITSGVNAVVDILEWDGTEFVSLIKANHGQDSSTTSLLARTLYWYEHIFDSFDVDVDVPIMNNGAYVEVKDVDGNSTKELVLTDRGPSHPDSYWNMGPWRGKRVVFSWDGVHFLYSDLEMEPPEYRFQALQDADRLFLLERYDESLSLYQNVIFADDYEWWTFDRQMYLMNLSMGYEMESPKPDPAEYPSLAAYARYRIVLHHLVRGWTGAAEGAYATLVERFPEGTVGHGFAEMAELLWTEYQMSADVEIACAKVVEYVYEHQDLLEYLGQNNGSQSHIYIPEDVCPFPFP